MESNGGSGNVRRLVRGPYVVKGSVRVHFGLTEEQRLAAQRVQNHVERASGKTVDGTVEIGLWSLRKGIEEHAKSLTRLQLGQEPVPPGSEGGIWLRGNVGFTDGLFGRAHTSGQETEEPEGHHPEPHV